MKRKVVSSLSMCGLTQSFLQRLFFLSLLTPASAPTSFEGPFGKVLHQVKAVIDTPRFSKDYKCNKIFYVLCPLNLNDIPDIEVRARLQCSSLPRVKCGNNCVVGHLSDCTSCCAKAG